MARQMKDSGIEWIGEIPCTWKLPKVKQLFDIGRGRVISQLELEPEGYPVYSSQTKNNGCLGYISTYDFDRSQLTWTTDGANAGTVFLREGKHNCTNVCGTLMPKTDDNDLKYLTYTLEFIAIYHKRADINGYKIMNNEMAEIVVTLPSFCEQQRIAAFLDRKCSEIDAVIERTKATIEEYKKLKQAVITEAVTKGVRGERKMKDSGIEWIGEIPEEWEVLPHKYVMHKEKSICEHYAGEDIISLTMNGVIVRDLTAGGKMPTTFDGYQYVEPDDMLLCLFDIDVTPRCVGIVRNHGVTSPAYSRFKVHVGYYNAYYDYLLRFIDDEKAFIHLSKNLRSSLTETDFGAIKTISPSYDEQVEIAAYLDEKCAALDTLIAKKTALLTELEAYKKSLIYEYVTGKREVQ